jgi:hypothetical protein
LYVDGGVAPPLRRDKSAAGLFRSLAICASAAGDVTGITLVSLAFNRLVQSQVTVQHCNLTARDRPHFFHGHPKDPISAASGKAAPGIVFECVAVCPGRKKIGQTSLIGNVPAVSSRGPAGFKICGRVIPADPRSMDTPNRIIAGRRGVRSWKIPGIQCVRLESVRTTDAQVGMQRFSF